LHLSDEEEKLIENLVQNIQKRIPIKPDTFSQDVMVSNQIVIKCAIVFITDNLQLEKWQTTICSLN
jgi:hypothetical protein